MFFVELVMSKWGILFNWIDIGLLEIFLLMLIFNLYLDGNLFFKIFFRVISEILLLGILIFIVEWFGIGVFICIFFVVKVNVMLLWRLIILFILIFCVGWILYCVIVGLILICVILVLILKFFSVDFKIWFLCWILVFEVVFCLVGCFNKDKGGIVYLILVFLLVLDIEFLVWFCCWLFLVVVDGWLLFIDWFLVFGNDCWNCLLFKICFWCWLVVFGFLFFCLLWLYIGILFDWEIFGKLLIFLMILLFWCDFFCFFCLIFVFFNWVFFFFLILFCFFFCFIDLDVWLFDDLRLLNKFFVIFLCFKLSNKMKFEVSNRIVIIIIFIIDMRGINSLSK